jgi:hypothetical protein
MRVSADSDDRAKQDMDIVDPVDATGPSPLPEKWEYFILTP